jgi:hypothetical protein
MNKNKKKEESINPIYLLLIFAIFIIIILLINYDGTNLIKRTLFDDNCSLDLINTFDITGCKR